jgi:hypothetical protein
MISQDGVYVVSKDCIGDARSSYNHLDRGGASPDYATCPELGLLFHQRPYDLGNTPMAHYDVGNMQMNPYDLGAAGTSTFYRRNSANVEFGGANDT